MGSKRKLVNGSDDDGSDGGSGEEESQLDLERSIKELCREDVLQQEGDRKMSSAKKVELISKLEEARHEDADLERMARRILWRREVRRTIAGNAEFKGIMEEVPLEEVEVFKKPRMSRLSLEWREAFKKDRASFLFPEVLKVKQSSELLTKRLWWKSDQSKDAEDVMDLILKWRLVSKSVKEAIDDLHSNDAVMLRNFSGFRAVRISSLKAAKNLNKKLGQNVNPFVFRRVWIEWSINKTRHEFWNLMKVILARWGMEIWSAYILFSDLPEDAEISNDYDLLAAYLKLMPNLRSLFLSGSFKKMDLKQLKDRIATNPLPELPNLRFASSAASGNDINVGVEAESGPSIITYSLLSRYHRDLETIELRNMTLPLESHLPSMQKLKLRFWYVSENSELDKLVNMNIFKGLNNWGSQLKELDLEVQGNAVPRHMLSRSHALKGLFLELPHLETLSISMRYQPLETLDILLPCKSLKTIIYSACQYRDDLDPWAAQNDEGIFQFPNRLNLYESNIWVLLPELKRIKMDIKTYKLSDRDKPSSVFYDRIKTGQYTRVGYQKHCKLQRVRSEMREEPK